MKTLLLLKRKLIVVTISLIIGGLFACQEDTLEPGNDGLPTLKNGAIEEIQMEGILPGGALYEIELPEFWNALPQKILLVYAHGYVDPGEPIELPNDFIGGIPIKDFVLTNLNMGYAATSYRENGLAVLPGIQDIVELRAMIAAYFSQFTDVTDPGYQAPPDALILVGPSEGGLVTVKTIEQHPELFDAALATCCPIGDFYAQLQYYGDAHVLFKYFFGPSVGGINLGSPKGVSKRTMNAWRDESLQKAIMKVLQDDLDKNNGMKIIQFLRYANIPAPALNPATTEIVKGIILEVMRFPIMATNDAIARIGGLPYNNKYPLKVYSDNDESTDDRKLNLTVERICRPDHDQAKQNLQAYETTGMLLKPLITLHNIYDHVSLFNHQMLYRNKVVAFGKTFPGEVFPVPPFFDPESGFLIQIPATNEYGHCNFEPIEIVTALEYLVN